MGISSSEMFLVIRARDEASRVLRGFGGTMRGVSGQTVAAAQTAYAHGAALTGVGTAMIATGVGMLSAFNDMTQSASTYTQQVASTATQVDQAGISLQNLSDIGLRMGKDLPVKFDQIQGSLYDIFSSIDTDGPGAERILRGIGVAAVAGSVDMETAGRTNIAIMNAWKMKAEDIDKVNDVMFQLVRKGVGTYDQFGKSIGRAIPSAVKSGQSVEDLAGAMAFMTRNGLSTSMAATSVARAMDAITKPKAQDALKELGVSVTDAQGKFRPFSEIVGGMREKLSTLTPVARAAKLDEIFKGSGGTIQAMRVFNLGINDSTGLLQNLTGTMHDAGGAANEAYDIMANTPEAQLQMLQNQYQVLSITLGNSLLPAKIALTKALISILNALNNLSPGMKKFIAYAGVAAAALSVVIGVVTMLAGLYLMLQGSLMLAGTSFAAIAGPIAIAIAAIAAIVAIGVILYKNWDTISAYAKKTWDAVWQAMQPLVSWLQSSFTAAWSAVVTFVMSLWSRFGGSLVQSVLIMWNGIKSFIDRVVAGFAVWGNLSSVVGGYFTAMGSVITTVVSGIIWPVIKVLASTILGMLVPAFRVISVVVREVFAVAGQIISYFVAVVGNMVGLVMAILSGNWSQAWRFAQDTVLSMARLVLGSLGALGGAVGRIVGSMLTNILSVFSSLGKGVGNLVKALVTGVIKLFTNLWDVLVGHSIVPDMVNAIIRWITKLPGQIPGLISGMVSSVIKFFTNLATQAGSKISGMASSVISKITGMASSVISKASGMSSSFTSKMSSMVSTSVNYIAGLPGKAASALSSLAGKLSSVGSSAIRSLGSAISGAAGSVTGAASGLASSAMSALRGGMSGAASIGSAIASGVASGISSGLSWVTGAARSLASSAVSAAKSALGIHSPSKVFMELGKYVGQGFVLGLNGSEANITTAASSLAKKVEAVFKSRLTGTKGTVTATVSKYTAILAKNQDAYKKYTSAMNTLEKLRLQRSEALRKKRSTKGIDSSINVNTALAKRYAGGAAAYADARSFLQATKKGAKGVVDIAYAQADQYMRKYVNGSISRLKDYKKKSDALGKQL